MIWHHSRIIVAQHRSAGMIIDSCLTTVNTHRTIYANLQGGKLAQAAKDGQRETLHNTLHYTITM